MPLYQTYADEIARLIGSGALKPGERMPSVREASRHRKLSAITIFKAYHLLEARGLIVAHARSGYFVSSEPAALPQAPQRSNPLAKASRVDRSELIFQVLDSAKQSTMVPLGSAFPSPLLFPLRSLYRALCRGARDLDPWRTVADITPGNAELRRQIALRYHIDGIRVDPDEIVITDGAMEALNLCLQAVARPGDAVIIESPTFYVALQALERLGLRAIEVATDPQEGIDLVALEKALRTQKPAACWLMPNFQNPLGALMPDDKKQQLVKLLATHGVPLIEDDVYGELYYAPTRPKPAKAYDAEGLVLHCGSFSKCLAPGYRVGWGLAGQHTSRVQRLKLGSTLSTALPSQIALAHYLNGAGYDRHLRQLRRSFEAQRDAMINAIAEFFPSGTRITRPQGGYFLWLELPKTCDTLQLQQEALRHGISIAPGAIFATNDRFAHCLRLNYGHPDDRRINRALRTLGKLAAR